MAAKKIEPAILLTIPIHLYPFDILVSFGHTDEQLNKIIKRVGVTDNYDFANYQSPLAIGKYAFWPNASVGLIRLQHIPRKTNEYAALMHEILHVVISCLRCIGMGIADNCESDEAYTYLMSYLVKEIFNAINKYY